MKELIPVEVKENLFLLISRCSYFCGSRSRFIRIRFFSQKT